MPGPNVLAKAVEAAASDLTKAVNAARRAGLSVTLELEEIQPDHSGDMMVLPFISTPI